MFASLANGDVMVYERDTQGSWSTGKKHAINLSTAAAPVTKMVIAAGKLWCSAANTVTVLHTSSLEIEVSIHNYLKVNITYVEAAI